MRCLELYTVKVMNGSIVSREAVVLAIQMGMISTARDLFSRYSNKCQRPEKADAGLEPMLVAAECVETEYGSGALLDLDHPLVNYFIDQGQVKPSEAETAKRFSTTKLTSFPLDEFVRGLTRHQARQLRR